MTHRPTGASAAAGTPAALAVRPAGRLGPPADECEALLAASRDAVYDDPAAALASAARAAELAEALLDALAPGDGRALDAEDLAAEVWAYRANAHRVLNDLDAAESAFAAARRHLEQGTGRPLLTARLADLEASLRSAQQRHDEALALLAEAIRRCRTAGARRLLGFSLVNRGYLLTEAGDPQAALVALAEAIECLHPEEDLRTYLFAASNVAKCLDRIGYSIAARALLAELRPLHERLGERINLLRLDWLEAEIDLGLGRHRNAEATLLSVRAAFLEREMVYDAALVSLELAGIYAEQKRFPALRRLALEMLPIFQSRRIHREALAALILFREAISIGRADLALFAEVRRFLDRARHNPRLRFRPGA